jgi:RHS repeat-associated protein
MRVQAVKAFVILAVACFWCYHASAQRTVLRTLTTTYEDYDPFGNPGTVRSTTGDKYTSTVTITYANRPASWLISLPELFRQMQKSPTGESVTRTTQRTYDPGGFLSSEVIEPSGDASVKLVRTFIRDSTGLVVSTKEASASQKRITQIGFDTLENTWPAYARNPLGQINQFAYHPGLGVVVAFQDENKVYTAWQVDRFGRSRRQKSTDGSDVQISYTPFGPSPAQPMGFVVSAQRVWGQEVIFFVDRLGRERLRSHRALDGRQLFVETSYDAAGRVSRISNPYFGTSSASLLTSFNYDSLGRLRTMTNPDGTSETWSYAGLATTVSDENGNPQRIVEDQAAQIITVGGEKEDGTPIETKYAYGPFGVPESITDPGGNVRKATFDVRGRQVSLGDPDSGHSTTGWNPFNEVVTQTNGLGNHFWYEHDLLGRVMNIRYREGTTRIRWDQSQNGIGLISSARTSDGVRTSFGYDQSSRLARRTTWARGREFRFDFQYDPTGRLMTIQYPLPGRVPDSERFAVSIGYTPNGAVNALTDKSGGTVFWRPTETNEQGEVTEEVFGNGAVTTRQFDTSGRAWSVKTLMGGLTAQDLAYDYYGNGNLGSRTDNTTGVNEEYSYDPLNRLTEWDVSTNGGLPFGQRFAYDNIGNLRSRTTVQGNGSNLTYKYSGVQAGPHAVTSINDDRYTYDAGGREASGPGRRTSYLSWGLPRRVVGPSQSLQFQYDYQQQRVVKSRSDGTRIFTLNGLFEQESKGRHSGSDTYYISGPDRIVAAVVRDASAKQQSVKYLHDDHLGSISAVTDGTGAVIGRLAYDPFGTSRLPADPSVPDTSSPPEPLGFTERGTDSEIKLLNMLGRLYEPQAGRFTTPDPIITTPNSSTGTSPYSYAVNNPLRWTDPTGFQPVTDLDPSNPTTWTDTWTLNGKNYKVTITAYPDVPENQTVGNPRAGTVDDNTTTYWQAALTPNAAASPAGPRPYIPLVERGQAISTIPLSDELWSAAKLSLPAERVGRLVSNTFGGPASLEAQIGYEVAQHFLRDIPTTLWKFAAHQPDVVFPGASGPIYETDEKLGFEGLKATTELANLVIPAAIEAGSLPKMTVAIGGGGRPIHVAFAAENTWLHADGNSFFNMVITENRAAAYVRWQKPLTFSVPVLDPAAVLRTEGVAASTCVTGACYAFAKGWGWPF